MEFLATLWMPIVVSAVAVFVVSSVVHMGLKYHQHDYAKMPDEDAVLDALRGADLAPGEYMFPRAESMAEMSTPEMKAKYERGPVGFLVLMRPGPFTMGPSLLQWFLYSLVVSVFCAYIADVAFEPGAAATPIFRVTGTAAVLVYGLGFVPSSIWKGVAWSTSARYLLDGVLYGLATGAVFAWLWPAA